MDFWAKIQEAEKLLRETIYFFLLYDHSNHISKNLHMVYKSFHVHFGKAQIFLLPDESYIWGSLWICFCKAVNLQQERQSPFHTSQQPTSSTQKVQLLALNFLPVKGAWGFANGECLKIMKYSHAVVLTDCREIPESLHLTVENHFHCRINSLIRMSMHICVLL